MSEALTVDRVVELLGLTPLVPEGGQVAQTWRDLRSSAIYYMMARPDFSALHCLEHVEIWAHHLSAPVGMLLIDPDGRISEPVLGPDLEAGQRPQVIVPPGTWQAAEPLGPWSLVSTFMAPPYEDEGVTFARWEDVAGRHPHHEQQIRRLCRF